MTAPALVCERCGAEFAPADCGGAIEIGGGGAAEVCRRCAYRTLCQYGRRFWRAGLRGEIAAARWYMREHTARARAFLCLDTRYVADVIAGGAR